jgi:hypothetical protein
VAKVGKLLGLISPMLAIGAMALMLFAPSHSYQSASCRSGYDHQPSNSECNYESGTIVLWVLAGLGMLSMIGLFIFPLALVLFVSAMLLTAARYESRRA